MKKYPPKLPRFNNIETEQEREKPAQLRGEKKGKERELRVLSAILPCLGGLIMA